MHPGDLGPGRSRGSDDGQVGQVEHSQSPGQSDREVDPDRSHGMPESEVVLREVLVEDDDAATTHVRDSSRSESGRHPGSSTQSLW